MAETTGTSTEVVYHSITGIPEEYNEFLPHDCAEYKAWKASLEEGGSSEKEAAEKSEDVEKKLPGGKVQKKKHLEVVIETTTRNKKKSITTIHGLDAFGVKLSEAAKACGKKFASGASVNKTASGKEQIDIQGDVSYELPDYLLSTYRSKGLKKSSLFQIANKKKQPVYDSDD